jgi:hypothetical protein
MMMTDMTDLFIYLPRVRPHQSQFLSWGKLSQLSSDRLSLGRSAPYAVTAQRKRRLEIRANLVLAMDARIPRFVF